MDTAANGTKMSNERDARMRDPGPDQPRDVNVVPPGVWVDDSDEDDPVLRQADGSLVDTWREEYPYAQRLGRDEYDHVKRLLQVELLKLQYWARDSGQRIVVVFEGRRPAEDPPRSFVDTECDVRLWVLDDEQVRKTADVSPQYLEKFFPVSISLSPPAPEMIGRLLRIRLQQRLTEQGWFKAEEDISEFARLFEELWTDSLQRRSQI